MTGPLIRREIVRAGLGLLPMFLFVALALGFLVVGQTVAVAFDKVGLFGFGSMMLFLAVLTIGFIYEWKKGALEWD